MYVSRICQVFELRNGPSSVYIYIYIYIYFFFFFKCLYL